jgi:hypothetical protein
VLTLALRSGCSLPRIEFSLTRSTLGLNLHPALPTRRDNPITLEHERLHPKVNLRDALLMLRLLLVLLGVATTVHPVTLAGELERGVRCKLPILAHAHHPVAPTHLAYLRCTTAFGFRLIRPLKPRLARPLVAVVLALAPHQVRVRVVAVFVVDGERVRKTVLGGEVARKILRELHLVGLAEFPRNRERRLPIDAFNNVQLRPERRRSRWQPSFAPFHDDVVTLGPIHMDRVEDLCDFGFGQFELAVRKMFGFSSVNP